MGRTLVMEPARLQGFLPIWAAAWGVEADVGLGPHASAVNTQGDCREPCSAPWWYRAARPGGTVQRALV